MSMILTRILFFRAEDDHQFHSNDVLGRATPKTYRNRLKDVQIDIGRLGDIGCPSTQAQLGLISLVLLGLGGALCSLGFLMPAVLFPLTQMLCAKLHPAPNQRDDADFVIGAHAR